MEKLLVWKDEFARPAHMAPYMNMVGRKIHDENRFHETIEDL